MCHRALYRVLNKVGGIPLDWSALGDKLGALHFLSTFAVLKVQCPVRNKKEQDGITGSPSSIPTNRDIMAHTHICIHTDQGTCTVQTNKQTETIQYTEALEQHW